MLSLETMTADQLATRVDETRQRLAEARKRDADLLAALSSAIATGAPVDDIRRERVLVSGDVAALPGAIATLEGAYRERMHQDASAAADERMARARTLGKSLTPKVAEAVKVLGALRQAVVDLRVSNPDLPFSDFGGDGTAAGAWSVALAHGGQQWETLLAGIQGAPAGVQEMFIASAHRMNREAPRVRTWAELT